ncbi:MAG: 4'-phosphopantetheinyl transferase superfamily protein [Cytophagales bacterium]|nr:4'-phosphopantetheinyl transferase superfamily protein [Cytophagales bacterium]
MPFTKFQQINESVAIGLWHIEEPLAFFQKAFSAYANKDLTNVLQTRNECKQTERLAARLCLKNLLLSLKEDYSGLEKNSDCVPRLLQSPLFPSISHTKNLACAAVHQSCPAGIDIEPVHPKVGRVAHKFVHPDEESFIDDLEKQTLLWTIKEAVYKRMQIRGLLFKEEIVAQPFLLKEEGILQVQVQKASKQKVSVFYKKIENCFLSVTLD